LLHDRPDAETILVERAGGGDRVLFVVGGGLFGEDVVMAGLCAFICPGLGHLIIGKPFQALIWFSLIVVGYVLFFVPGLILHLISIIDAARAGRRDQISAMTQAIRNANK